MIDKGRDVMGFRIIHNECGGVAPIRPLKDLPPKTRSGHNWRMIALAGEEGAVDRALTLSGLGDTRRFFRRHNERNRVHIRAYYRI